jgi:hypothetical protein
MRASIQRSRGVLSYSTFSLEMHHFSPPAPSDRGHHAGVHYRRTTPLLAELHAHTTWSDGAFTVGQLVDLYGTAGFDVLAVTDHAYRSDDPWLASREGRPGVDAENFAAYLDEIEREAARAWERYRLLVIPGIELSYNDLAPTEAAHAVAVGLREFVSLEKGIGPALVRASLHGAAIIGAHPYDSADDARPGRLTTRFATDPDGLARLVHRFELFNRSRLFPWVARAGHASVATGDFHRLEHLDGWKTLVPCERHGEAVVAHLRSTRPVYLARFDVEVSSAAA